MGSRVVVSAVLLAASVAVAFVLLRSDAPYELELRFQNAGQLVNGNLVTVGGVKAGTVKDIRLASDNSAIVLVALTEKRFQPLHEGTTVDIRISSLSSVANRSVSLTPGPDNAPALAGGATVPVTATTSPVEVDQIITTLDAQTRSSLQALIHGGADALAGGSAQGFNRTLAALNPAVGETSKTLDQLITDRGALKNAVVDTAALFGVLSSEREAISGTLRSTAALSSALATRTDRLASVLRRAPRGIGDLSTTVNAASRTFDQLVPTARRLAPVVAPLRETVRRGQPVLVGARKTLAPTTPLLGDLATTLRSLPGLRDAGVPALRSVDTTGRSVLPILRTLLPYFPDTFQGLVGGFGGQVGGYYDANGGYVRIAPIVGPLSAQGALALPLQGKSGLSVGNTNRCPGGAQPEGQRPTSQAFVQPTGCRPEDSP